MNAQANGICAADLAHEDTIVSGERLAQHHSAISPLSVLPASDAIGPELRREHLSAVAACSSAERKLDAASAAAEARVADADALRRRAADLASASAELAQRRARGDCRPGDAGLAEVQRLDRSEIQALAEDAGTTASAAWTTVHADRRALVAAEARLQTTEAKITCILIVATMALAEAMVDAAGGILAGQFDHLDPATAELD